MTRREKRIEKLRAYHAEPKQIELTPDRMALENALRAKRRKDTEPVDPLCLTQACEGVAGDLKDSCRQWAEHYNVPDEVVFRMVADQFIFMLSGVQPLSPEYFAELATEIVAEEAREKVLQ